MPDFSDVCCQCLQLLVRQLRQIRGCEEEVVMSVISIKLRHNSLNLFSQRFSSDLGHESLDLVDVTLRHLRQIMSQLREDGRLRVLGLIAGAHQAACNAG